MRVPSSPRLTYRRLATADLEAFHALATDPHVRRFLLDGAVVDRAWCSAERARSDELFTSHGVGLWLASDAAGDAGFCGFRLFEELDPGAPQLLYALPERRTGAGLATEMARACVRFAREIAGMCEITAAVDAPNVASTRVLEKLGFERAGASPGPFGETLRFTLRAR